jgi:hypothetical protein
MRMIQNPMPTVEHDGNTYKLKSRKLKIPDFKSMSRIEVLLWLNTNTYARGYSAPPNPLRGLGNAIALKSKGV